MHEMVLLVPLVMIKSANSIMCLWANKGAGQCWRIAASSNRLTWTSKAMCRQRCMAVFTNRLPAPINYKMRLTSKGE